MQQGLGGGAKSGSGNGEGLMGRRNASQRLANREGRHLVAGVRKAAPGISRLSTPGRGVGAWVSLQWGEGRRVSKGRVLDRQT